MKFTALISCVLLSTLVLLLLSTTIQAAEYREVDTKVKAEDILKHIEKGDDINLTSCRIVGELNVSKIKLETTPNPYFYKLRKGENYFILSDPPNNLSIIESNIRVENSIFENDLDFSSSLFRNSVDFTGTKFNGSTNFFGSNFNGDAGFSETSFNSYAHFTWTNFNDSVDFSHTIFNGPVDFSGTTFNDYTSFCTNFNDEAYFVQANFNGDVGFFETNFNGDAYFTLANFNNSVDFLSTKINGCADFGGTKFIGTAFFEGMTFNDSADFDVPITPENIVIADGTTCDSFRKFYRSKSQFVDADTIYYNYRKYSMDNESLTSLSKWTDLISWIICGYGVRPFNTLYLGGFLILLFSIIYAKGPAICVYYNDNIPSSIPPYIENTWEPNKDKNKFLKISSWYKHILTYPKYIRLGKTGGKTVNLCLYSKDSGISILVENDKNKSSEVSYKDALYFSITTFTTVGYGNWYPKENFRKWATLEGLLGWITLGIFMATLTAVMIRS